ncbi:MAG TPA: sigma-70 family RNA polymerase sigma factor, partial [Solirubrobacteraceae bacterium]
MRAVTLGPDRREKTLETNVKAIELRELWRRYKSDGDPRARERLVVAYSPLVKYVAGRMASGLPAHVEEADLISYGLGGLISAIERFDLTREIKFETYAITRIRGAPDPQVLVDQSELRELWRRYKNDGDPRARERLVVAYSPLVKYVAGRTAAGLPPHVEEADLVSYGLVGLISAIERFDPSREIKFETYAITRIKGAIIDELRSIDWVPRSVRARAREIERANTKLEHRLQRSPTDEEVAAELNLTVSDFHESLLTISHSSVAALDE